MAYKLVEFDGVSLPLYNAGQALGVAPVESTLVNSVGSVFDYYGARQRLARRYTISAEGEMLGETVYLIDAAGNRLVDEAGNALIAGSPAANLRGLLQALRSKIGVRGTLWRQRLDYPTAMEWITARCLDVSWDREVTERTVRARVKCTFESTMTAWRAAAATVASVSASANTLTGLRITVAGDAPVNDVVLRVQRTSGTITAVRVTVGDLGVDWTWTGSIGASETLTLDAGARTVRENNVDVYSGLSFAAAHTARGWLPLAPGMHACQVLCTGGAATVSATHYDQWQ